MKRHEHLWQQFAMTGDPKAYLAYKKNHKNDDSINVKNNHANH